jgi:large subunit ribosomal protein L32e
MNIARLKNKMSRKRKTFKRQESHRYKKLGEKWRKPKGKHSKLRQKYNGEKMVSIGYRGPVKARGLHPSGKRDVLVHNPKELEGLKDVLVRIGAKVGKKKKLEIIKKAQNLKLKVINMIGTKSKKVKEVKKDEPKVTKKAGK